MSGTKNKNNFRARPDPRMAPLDPPDSRGVGAGLDLHRGDSTNVVDQDCGEVPRQGTVKNRKRLTG